MLRFQLEGFAGVLVGVTVQPGAESQVVATPGSRTRLGDR